MLINFKKGSPDSSDVHTPTPGGRKKNKLKNLKITEVSLVDRPANQYSKVVLYKRHELINDDILTVDDSESFDRGVVKIMPKTLEELQKAFDEQAATNAALTSKLEKAEKDNAEMATSLKSLEDKVSKSATAEDEAKAAAEALKKSMPEDVRKAFDAMQAENEAVKKQLADENAEIKKNLDQEILKRQQAEFIQKAEKEYPNLPGQPAQKGQFLQAVEKMGKDEKEFALSLLKSADESFSKAMTEIGSAASPAVVGAKDELNKKAQAVADAKNISFAKAYDEVISTSEGKKLYEEASK
jgi:hypothetical protein